MAKYESDTLQLCESQVRFSAAQVENKDTPDVAERARLASPADSTSKDNGKTSSEPVLFCLSSFTGYNEFC